MVGRLLFLEPGHLRRIWPFFAVYLVLFAALTLADGLSLALVVSRIGAESLPRYQAVSALCVMLAMGWYLRAAGRQGSGQVFVAILLGPLLLFALLWAAMNVRVADERCLGLFFVGRELGLALVLLHFGAYLQDYFTRCELNRVMPVVYAGGRVGGILAGATLEHVSQLVEPAHLLLLIVALLAASILGVKFIGRHVTPLDEPDEQADDARLEQAGTPRSFLGLVWKSPLLFWITASTVALFLCRAGLSLEYGSAFERALGDDAAVAAFLGRYTQIALAVALAVQLLLVGRMVAAIGLHGAQIVYALLIVAAALGGWGSMPLGAAVFARFVETELRYGMRNPLAQLTVNLFPRQIRTQARAWSLGIVIPMATLVASLGFGVLARAGAFSAIAICTCVAAACYLAASLPLAASIGGSSHRIQMISMITRLTSNRPSMTTVVCDQRR